jgi:hypothetical protein
MTSRRTIQQPHERPLPPAGAGTRGETIPWAVLVTGPPRPARIDLAEMPGTFGPSRLAAPDRAWHVADERPEHALPSDEEQSHLPGLPEETRQPLPRQQYEPHAHRGGARISTADHMRRMNSRHEKRVAS